MSFKIPSDWKLNQDAYDVGGSVLIKNTDLVDGNLPVKFGQVGGDFDCGGCPGLTSLRRAPEVVVGNFFCDGCPGLTSLSGAPKVVRGNFYCVSCTGLTSLQGATQSVRGDFHCDGCTGLTSLSGAPRVVGGNFDCQGCTSLKSLQGIEHTKGIETFHLPPNLESHVLGLFYTGCMYVNGGEPGIKIINKYLPLGQKGLVQCSIALVKAGYKALAQL